MSESPLFRTVTLGRMRIHLLEAGRIRLDGGAMFGVVPKPLWERRATPDDRNRIPLAMRCLLVETPDDLVLVDTGLGGKEPEKFRSIYGVENDGSPSRLEEAIRAAGFAPEEVGMVINSHLHFDHAGGNTLIDEEGRLLPAFPQARYVAHPAEFEFAASWNERIRASYLAHNLAPITDAGLWEWRESGEEILPGISFLATPGHTPHHQSLLLRSGGEIGCFLADACPTTAHLPLPWIMGYDLEPLRSLESKRELWRRAEGEDWLLFFEHDPVTGAGRLDPSAAHPSLIPVVTTDGDGG